jgi:acetyl-CoA carboxylase, biotin carboxylase subunit
MTGADLLFSKILIANRGEIAVRIARTCRELGIRTVAAYSTEDRDSAVVRMADEAIQIGPAAAARSYMSMAALIEAARLTRCEAIHPGYGFLSEDPDFAEACAANDVAFIGPTPEILAQLGDKPTARAVMAAAGLPLLPGSIDPVQDIGDAHQIAEVTGYPLMIKAASGGGGRGIRLVNSAAELAAAMHATRRDGQAWFHDGRVYLERHLTGARHVEVQILRDAHGTTLELGERDCSLQRRYQKLVEETPAPGLSVELLSQIRAAAVRGAEAIGYTGAGTFEFLVDSSQFYFMEVNGRIQVEHPVTEAVTGIDLVREQIRIAAGLPLQYRQPDIQRRGAAIECRVNAEDPASEFAPAPGLISEFVPPSGPFVRVDTYSFPGARISPAYDSLIAKVITWATDRPTAISRMDAALAEFRINGPGIRTNIQFLREIIRHPLFLDARHNTNTIQHLQSQISRPHTTITASLAQPPTSA